jgi:sialate O-acetylesterase
LIRFFTVGDQFSKEPLTTLRGEWKPVSPATVGSCSAVSYYFARDLQKHTGVPIGLLVSSVGGTRIESWMRTETFVNMTEAAPLLAKWKDVSAGELAGIVATYRAYQYQRDHVHPQAVAKAKATGAPLPAAPTMPKTRGHDCPAALHNGMIAPLQPYAIRGAIWYQGESNAGQATAYKKLLPAMIADWRAVWGRDMPFLFVQLAPHQSIHPSIREAQYHIWRDTPRSAMVVTTDVGDPNDIHPTRKQPVGSRLALAARALSYGETVEFSGPVFQEMHIEQHRAIVSFSHRGTGLMSQGETLQGFTIAGADGVYVPATATIVGDTVVVTSEKVPHPTHVRYCWAKVPEGNLFNRGGLPAVPFRSDDSKKTIEKK